MVSLLTDYGLEDGFVGALHGVLRSRAPGVDIVDITHGIRFRDIRAGSLALQRAAPYLAAGAAVAVVDPGVGTDRRAVAVATSHVTFIGPDNGLLVPAVETLGGAVLALELEDRGYWLSAPGPTFAGRDVFAPAAARLASGGDILSLGPPIDTGSLVQLPGPFVAKREDGSLEAEVTWVDRYGNVQLAAGPDDLGPTRPALTVMGAGGRWEARLVKTFADLGAGELGVLVDSYGSLALCLNGTSAARQLGLAEAERVVLAP